LRGYQRDLVKFVQDRIARIVPPEHAENTSYLRDISMSLFAMVNWHFQWDGKADVDRRRAYARTICQLICSGS